MKRTAITLSATDCALTPFSMAKIGHVTTVTGTRTCNLSFSIRMSGTHTPKLCVPNSVIRPVGLTSTWPVPYAPSEVFSADAAHTFGHLTHRMDLAGFSSRWWGNCSYSYQSSKHRRFPFIRAPFANFGSWLRHTIGEALASDLMSNTLSYLVLSGYFSVEAGNIRRYPLALYQALAAQQVAPNEEVDHFIERLW